MGNCIAELAAPLGLEAQEIPEMVNDFRVVARNAIEAGKPYIPS